MPLSDIIMSEVMHTLLTLNLPTQRTKYLQCGDAE